MTRYRLPPPRYDQRRAGQENVDLRCWSPLNQMAGGGFEIVRSQGCKGKLPSRFSGHAVLRISRRALPPPRPLPAWKPKVKLQGKRWPGLV